MEGDVVEERFYTIGMAGHIDHGKTTLTKALTNVETDSLKEEKDRSISIELGYAPFRLNHEMQVSLVDVPGHERFIRQMIAGVVGIDLVIMVIAADEGVMPQTKEHIEILAFLGIDQAVIAVTKIDRVEPELLELVKEDINDTLADTVFKGSETVFVDSISKKGINVLKKTIEGKLIQVERKNKNGPFRQPIDDVFTVQGQGTVVRGTVFEGTIKEGEIVTLLPHDQKIRVRSLQVHHQPVKKARAGQRVAINIGGVSREDVSRGDVLVGSHHYQATKRVDVSLTSVTELRTPLKQRSLVKIHMGTAIVMGKIIFFDRNELTAGDEILCQLQLDEPVVAKRGERFILRRPSPIETVGGGWVIDPQTKKHRFGLSTIQRLQQKKNGTPEDRIIDVLSESYVLSLWQLLQQTGLGIDSLKQALNQTLNAGIVKKIGTEKFVLNETIVTLENEILMDVRKHHEDYSLRIGVDKATIIQSLDAPQALLESVIDSLKKQQQLKQKEQYLALNDFIPSFPEKWATRMERVINDLEAQQLKVETWDTLVKKQGIPAKFTEDLKHFLLQQNLAYKLDSDRLIHSEIFLKKLTELLVHTGRKSFSLQQAKEVLDVSRKYRIPFLELLDRLRLTIRDGNERKWVNRTVNEYTN